MDTFIVVLIVGLAIFYVGRKFINNLQKSTPSSCGCGCSACNVQSDCADAEKAQDSQILNTTAK